jgi:predicted RNase H-like HicB family nuclease
MSTTSNRRAAFQQPQTNPSQKFIEWKSNDKGFSYYDKETKENVAIPLPFKFLVLDELHTVKGWNDASSSQINSNEVKFISRDEMIVKPFKGNEIAKGLYKDIKEKIKAAGGHYVKSVYCMLEDGSIANLQLKGGACQSYGDFTAKTRSRLTDEWVVVDKAIDGKKGAIKYTTPGFAFNKSLSESEADLADEAYNVLEAYLKTYLTKSEPIDTIAPSETDEVIEEDDLDY